MLTGAGFRGGVGDLPNIIIVVTTHILKRVFHVEHASFVLIGLLFGSDGIIFVIIR